MSGNGKVSINVGNGLVPLLITMFLSYLKVEGHLDISWFWALFPLILPLGIFLFFISIFILAIIAKVLDR